jgi:hypothetical protein
LAQNTLFIKSVFIWTGRIWNEIITEWILISSIPLPKNNSSFGTLCSLVSASFAIAIKQLIKEIV